MTTHFKEIFGKITCILVHLAMNSMAIAYYVSAPCEVGYKASDFTPKSSFDRQHPLAKQYRHGNTVNNADGSPGVNAG